MAVVGSMVTFRPRNNLAARMGVTSCAALITKLSAGCASLMVYPKGEAPFQVYGVRLDAALSVEHSFSELVGGAPAVPPPNGWVFVGDSITYGYDGNNGGTQLADPYPKQFSVITGKPSINQGVTGRALQTMDANYASEAAPQFSTTYNGMMVLGGINDIASNSKTDIDLRVYIQSICGKARATGFKVGVGTLTPSVTQNGTQNGYVAAYNTWLRANYASFADYLVDFAATFTSSADTVLFGDGLHPTLAGAAEFANLACAAFGYTRVTDTTAPTIYTSASATGIAGVDKVFRLEANEKVTWSKSGANAADVTLSGTNNGLATFSAPSAGTHSVTFTATDVSGNTASLSLVLTVSSAYTNLIANNKPNGSWSAGNMSIVANAATAVDGTTTASTLREVNDYPSDRNASPPGISTSAQNYTCWMDIKAVSRTWIGIAVQDNTATTRIARFNLATGAMGTVDSAIISATITPLANGYYRCKVQTLATGSVWSPAMRLLSDGTTATSDDSHPANTAAGVNISDTVMAIGLI